MPKRQAKKLESSMKLFEKICDIRIITCKKNLLFLIFYRLTHLFSMAINKFDVRLYCWFKRSRRTHSCKKTNDLFSFQKPLYLFIYFC